MAVYITLEKPVAGMDHIALVNGKSVAQNWETLNDLARQNGISPLEKFIRSSYDD